MLTTARAGARGQACRMAASMRTPEDTETDADGLIRLGKVASVDLAAARCTVSFDDEAESPPLRWIEGAAGATRTWSPPSVGEQVVLLCPAGEIAAAVVLRGLFSTAHPAPGNTARRLIEFADGAVIAYDPESHELEAILPGGATLALVADGGIAITGDIILTGKLTASDDVIAAGKSLKGHVHSGVQAGASNTGAPA